MSRRRPDFQPIDAGDIEVYDPRCRSRILLTRVEMQRDARRMWLYVEGVCKTCDRYVRLRMINSGLEEV